MSIKLFVMDVDGTMTDGKIYMGSNGEMFKAFDIKDGFGIHEILPAFGILPVIMTGRTSRIVLNRAKELGISHVIQNAKDKGAAIRVLSEELDCGMEQMAYIGDDIIDIKAMELCGIKGCPQDAVDSVKEICDFVSSKKGGEGAVREFIEWLVYRNNSDKREIGRDESRFIKDTLCEFNALHDELEDEYSKNTLEGVLNHRLTRDKSYLDNI